MLEQKKLNRQASRMARFVALAALAGCLLMLNSYAPSVQARVIVRRQAEESVPTVVSNNAEQMVTDAVPEVTTLAPTDEDAANKVATTPPRPNDRFEQFPAEGLNSDSAVISADVSEDELTSSLAETMEREEEAIAATTLAPSGEESVGQDSSGTVEEDSANSSSSQATNESLSDSQQQSDSGASDKSEDSTELSAVNTVVSAESTANNAITTPAPTAAPARSDALNELGSEVENLSSGSGSSSVELQTLESEPSAESDQSSRPESTEQTVQQQGPIVQDTVAEETTTEVRVDDEDVNSVAAVTAVPVPEANPDAETLGAAGTNRTEDDGERFDLSRYTAPSNYSQGAVLRNESSTVDEVSFDDAATELSTEEPLPVTTLSTLNVDSEDESTSNGVRVNESVERNSSVSVERTQIETTAYEESSNEVDRNQTQTGTIPSRTKKGKFLDQFNEETTEDNDINLPNGAAWALAGMRMVERKQSDVGQAVSESTETVRDDSENVVANNTLKQLMDWAIIMQQADFANSSFVRSTVSSDEPSVGKDRRTYANKVPTVEGGDVLSEENRLTAIVTEAAPTRAANDGESVATEAEDANVVDTTFVPSTEKPNNDGQELEDFKFEDRSTSSTTMANEVVGSSDSGNVVPTTTRRTYEVSENVDETELATKIRNTPEIRTSTTTTQRSDVSTGFGMFEDVPVTTYSPVAPILRRTEQTTPPIPITTMITRIASTMPARRPITLQQELAGITTTDVSMKEATSTDLGSATFTTTVSNSELPPVLREGSDSKPLDQDTTEFSEVNQNVRTDERLPVPTTTTISTVTTVVPNLSSATQTNNVEFDDSSAGENLIGQSSVTTERSESPQLTTDETADEGGKVPIVLDDKHLYDMVSTTTIVATTTTSTSSSAPTTEHSSGVAVNGSGQSVGISAEAYTTRRTIDRSMTTTELSEEESVTEEDYIELNNVPAAGGTSKPQGDGQNQTDQSEQGVQRQDTNGTTEQSQSEPAAEEDNSVVVAVVASIVSVIVVLLLIAAFIVFRKRQNQVSYGQRCRPVGLDAYSLDNVSVYNSVRRKGNTARMSKRSYGNSAFEDPNFKTNPLTVAELANIIHNKTAIYDEFKEIPNVTARADEVPEGCEDKNRYANVVPLPETRVHLKRMSDDEKTEYINANFVKGPKDSANYYIACQAPMENTINDFWRMVWEQNSKVIIMATDLSENGVEKCAEYLPPSVVLDNSRTFGDFQLTLKNRENKEKYTISTVHMRHTPSNTMREIMHFWYQWPDTGVPIDESSIIGMLLEARTYLKLSPSELAEFATIAEETEESPVQPSEAANGTDTTNASNNNNNNNNNNATSNGTAGAGKEPTSIVSNGGTMDKHKSLQRTQGPLTVHCSPGTGRTGTLVACDIALRLLEVPPRTVDLPQIVYYVRRGRASAVRTREQYELIYRVANVYATKLTGPTIET
ncbi:mucin-5AC isoform X2 [Anopheles funestus]|uniref:mucin-5AC isoform X2 n=1 Tax=Anopheles funestus TaxID=62324 RepID=UPI0020C72D64|nr:mucin-5AC isoform X2 [Anopheles funestus]